MLKQQSLDTIEVFDFLNQNNVTRGRTTLAMRSGTPYLTVDKEYKEREGFCFYTNYDLILPNFMVALSIKIID